MDSQQLSMTAEDNFFIIFFFILMEFKGDRNPNDKHILSERAL